jgi:hypothetical protein
MDRKAVELQDLHDNETMFEAYLKEVHTVTNSIIIALDQCFQIQFGHGTLSH